MIRIYIVDDEKKSIDNLEFLLLQEIDEDLIIESTNDPLEAVQKIRAFKVDLLFLDVQMPHLDGFGILKALGKIDFEVIFITAYEQYAIDAIKMSALDYLLKPIDADDLKNAFSRFRTKKEELFAKEETIKVKGESGKITISQIDGIHFLEISKISRLESDGNYTKIYSDNGKSIVSSKTLKKYDDLLEEFGFFRVHNSHLINCSKIVSILKNELIVMEDGSEVPLSRRKRKDLRILMGID
jgi:two-component system LytT family response regulator